jgi:REP element-mobilizing transposase RayT
VSTVPQLALDLSDRGRHGGRRNGAGRTSNRAKGLRTRVPHRAREKITRHTPLHVTLRIEAGVGWLRRRDCYRAVRRAMVTAQARLETFRICHVSIQANHVHLIVEANDRAALTSGMTGFLVSAAKRLNAAIGRRTGTRRRGRVFADRYHTELLTSPTQTRNAIAYVINNWRHHREDRGSQLLLDPYATGATFDGFREHRQPLPWPDEDPLPIAFPTSFLLREAWRRDGLLSARQIPGTTR